MSTCEYCKGSGKVLLLENYVECECVDEMFVQPRNTRVGVFDMAMGDMPYVLDTFTFFPISSSDTSTGVCDDDDSELVDIHEPNPDSPTGGWDGVVELGMETYDTNTLEGLCLDMCINSFSLSYCHRNGWL